MSACCTLLYYVQPFVVQEQHCTVVIQSCSKRAGCRCVEHGLQVAFGENSQSREGDRAD